MVSAAAFAGITAAPLVAAAAMAEHTAGATSPAVAGQHDAVVMVADLTGGTIGLRG